MDCLWPYGPGFTSCSIHFNPLSIQFQRVELIERLNWMNHFVLTSSIQWINFTTFTLNAVNEWFIDYISLTSLHFGKSTHSIRIHTAQAKRSELLGLYWVIAFIVVSLYRFTLAPFPFITFTSAHRFVQFISFGFTQYLHTLYIAPINLVSLHSIPFN